MLKVDRRNLRWCSENLRMHGRNFTLTLGTLAALIVSVGGAPLQAANDELVAADEELLKKAGVGTDGGDLLAFLRQRTLTDADRERLALWIRQLGSDSFALRDRATSDILALGPPALPILERALHDPDPEVARRAEWCTEEIKRGPGAELPAAAVRLLALRKPAGAVPALLAYLPFAEDGWVEEEVLAALVALCGPPGDADPSVAAALHDPSAARRSAAAYVLGRSGTAEQRAVVRKFLADGDPKVRFQADAPLTLTWQVEELLYRIAGDQAPPVSIGDGSAESRQKCRDAWGGWWRTHGDQVNLAALKDAPRLLGLTVIAEMNSNKVWECGPDGKPRWKLENLQGPIEAHVLPGGRVLVAEYQGQRVTERDLQGNVLWEKRLSGNPIVCQRLPNGNTFIAMHNGLLEVTRAGKEVYAHSHGQNFFIFGAQKLRNGHIICVSNLGIVQEIDAATGKELKSHKQVNIQGGWCSVEELPGGRFLLAILGTGQVLEIDTAGKSLWTCAVPGAISATRLPNGHTLVSSMSKKQVVEVDRDGKQVSAINTEGQPWRVHRR
jgi:hypothetical protein